MNTVELDYSSKDKSLQLCVAIVVPLLNENEDRKTHCDQIVFCNF